MKRILHAVAISVFAWFIVGALQLLNSAVLLASLRDFVSELWFLARWSVPLVPFGTFAAYYLLKSLYGKRQA